jgi:DNA-binding response OmpR family regulator
MTGDRILVIEDDATIGRALTATLETEGHDVGWFRTADDALRDAVIHSPALVLLDLGLPDRDGIDVCHELRALAPRTRIIMVTARADEVDIVVGLDAGADDYVIKPFRLAELLARVRAHLRRVDGDDADTATLTVGDVSLNRGSRRAWVGDREIELRPKEFDLFALLVLRVGQAVTREQIMEEVWDAHWFGSTKTLDMHILALRRKLEHSSVTITTLRHVGYRLDP